MTQSDLVRWAESTFDVTIGRSTMSDIIKSSDKWLNIETDNKTRNKRPKHAELEEALLLWFNDIRTRGILVNDEMLRNKAQQFGNQLEITDFQYSKGWLQRFKDRHSIKAYRVHGESATVNAQDVDESREALRKVIQDYAPEDVYNCDESGLYFKMESKMTLCTAPVSGRKQPKDRYAWYIFGILTNSYI